MKEKQNQNGYWLYYLYRSVEYIYIFFALQPIPIQYKYGAYAGSLVIVVEAFICSYVGNNFLELVTI